MVQEKKGMLKVWNMVLVSTAFSLAIFGDFLTRSGVVNSVHSFVQSAIGPWLLGFLAVVIAFSVTMIVWRLPLLRADHKLESVVSREATFLFNNLLLLALCFAICWGVVFPILSQALRGITSSVSTPYYNFFLVMFGIPLLLLTGIGPLIAWRRASTRSLARTFRWPVASAAAGTVLFWLAGLGSSWAGMTALSLCIFVTTTILLEFARGTSARMALTDAPAPRALFDLIGRNRRRYGGYIVHLAVVLLVIGIVASGSYASVGQRHLAPGQSMVVDGYRLTNIGLFQTREQNSVTSHVRLAVSHDGRSMGTLDPGLRLFDTQQVSNEVDIHTNLLTLTDLYTILQGIDPNGGGVQVKVLVNPMIGMIWLAGGVFLLGALIALWPDPREVRMLARRYAGALAREA
jgi:cytochrome c-type biogenesis protein CcmF